MRLLVMLLWATSLFAGSLGDRIHYDPNASEKQPNRVGHILIDDKASGISQSTWVYVKNALDYYQKQRPIFIILELNTPGGEVFAAQKISDALKEMDTQYDVPIVAFINNWAISAGAMLAYSSRYIGTVKDGSMGAAEPVLQGEGGKMESASEKVNSAIRSDFANRAAFFDRNPFVAEAMVDKDIILVRRGSDILKLDNDTQILLGDILLSPKGKLLTLTAKEMIEIGVADFLVPPAKTVPLTEEEKVSGHYPAAKSLLFTYPFFKEIPNAVIDAYRMDWKGHFFALLAHPVVQSILFLALMLGIYMEISSPGFGIPGTVALTAIILMALSSFSQEIGGLLELILLLVGLAIILIDIFVFPTFGLLGFIGAIFFLIGLFGMMLPGFKEFSFDFDTQTLNAAGEIFILRLAYLAATFVVGLAMIALLAKYVMPHFNLFQRFVLQGYEQESFKDTSLPQVGVRGIAATSLRPSGKVEVEESLYDAVTEGSFIDKGEGVKVVRIDGSSVVVTSEEKS